MGQSKKVPVLYVWQKACMACYCKLPGACMTWSRALLVEFRVSSGRVSDVKKYKSFPCNNMSIVGIVAQVPLKMSIYLVKLVIGSEWKNGSKMSIRSDPIQGWQNWI